jgi:hypothetical protein
MSTARFRSALASTCTSLLLATAALAQGAVEPAQSALELELELARSRDLYLVIDPGAQLLEVKVRGMVLDSMPILYAARQALVPLVGGGPAPDLEMPVLWHVTKAPEDTWRRVIAPPSLRPYTEDEEEPTPTPAPPDSGPPPTHTPTPTPVEVPTDYDFKVDSGWVVEVSAQPPPGMLGRLVEAVSSGWSRLLGRQLQSEPPRLLLVLSPEDARRVRHLFIPGAAVLVAANLTATGQLEPPSGS